MFPLLMLHALFYKYVDLDNLEELQPTILESMKKNGIKGTILLSDEGINGAFTGQEQDFKTFINWLCQNPEFSDIEWKITPVDKHQFNKTKCKIRSEIVSLRQEKTKLEHRAPYVEPEEFKEWLDNGEELLIIDARNDYESKVGRFKGAHLPQIKTFRHWPEAVAELEEFKNKKIVTYCTGGIRCEKASAYMKEQGFANVYQLHGGIVKYGQVVGDEHWEGKCFVFDKRLVADIDPNKVSEHITTCEFSGVPCSTYHNCSVLSCDALFIATKDQWQQHQGKCPSCTKQVTNNNKEQISA